MKRLAAAFVLATCVLAAAGDYPSEIAEWRRNRETVLKSNDNWLTVSGLFFLQNGANPFGKGRSNSIVLPDGPERAGTFTLANGKVTATVDGQTRDMRPNTSGDVVKAGRLSLLLLESGGVYTIRLKDPESKYRREFTGIDYYPPVEGYRVEARFVPRPTHVPLPSDQGGAMDYPSPGYVEFNLNGRDLKLTPVLESPNARELLYIFRDQTSGKETYGGGRFLHSDLPRDGRVVLDFNKAYNPPCAFTPYAICPLPPRENRLSVRIEAGEKKYGH